MNKHPINMPLAIEKQKIFECQGRIYQMNKCCKKYISLYIPQIEQIQVFDPVNQEIIKKFSLPRRIRWQNFVSYHLVTNDLKHLILVWEKDQYSEIYEDNNTIMVERLKGQVLGYLKNRIILIKSAQPFNIIDESDKYILIFDIFNKSSKIIMIEIDGSVQFKCFQKQFLIIFDQLSQLQFFNQKLKKQIITFKQEWSPNPQINFSHNSNLFLFGFNQTQCLRFIIGLHNYRKQIRKVTLKSHRYSILEVGNYLIYQDLSSYFIYQLNFFNYQVQCITRGHKYTQIQSTQDNQYLVCSKTNKLNTLDLKL